MARTAPTTRSSGATQARRLPPRSSRRWRRTPTRCTSRSRTESCRHPTIARHVLKRDGERQGADAPAVSVLNTPNRSPSLSMNELQKHACFVLHLMVLPDYLTTPRVTFFNIIPERHIQWRAAAKDIVWCTGSLCFPFSPLISDLRSSFYFLVLVLVLYSIHRTNRAAHRTLNSQRQRHHADTSCVTHVTHIWSYSYRAMQRRRSLLGPPNFFMSRQKRHSPQSSRATRSSSSADLFGRASSRSAFSAWRKK